jgi:hypothetical protein
VVAVAGFQGVDEGVVQGNCLEQVFEAFVGWLAHVRHLATPLMVMT